MCNPSHPSLPDPTKVINSIPNPIPSLGVPGVVPPEALIPSGKFMNPFDPIPSGPPASTPPGWVNNTYSPSILGMLGRGVLDTTILGQNRRAPSVPSSTPYTAGTLG